MNTDEYNSCVELFSDGLYRFALKMLKNVELAEDNVQDTFENLWRRRAEVTFDRAKSYLFTSTYNGAIDTIRREKHRAEYLQHLPSEAEHQSGYSDVNEVLDRVVDQLPEVQKSVLLLRDYEGYTYEEIGEITNLTLSQVKVYLYRARVFLKEKLVSIDALI